MARRLALAGNEIPKTGDKPRSKQSQKRRERRRRTELNTLVADVRADDDEATLHAREVMSARRAALALRAGIEFIMSDHHDPEATRMFRELYSDKGLGYLIRLAERGVAACVF